MRILQPLQLILLLEVMEIGQRAFLDRLGEFGLGSSENLSASNHIDCRFIGDIDWA